MISTGDAQFEAPESAGFYAPMVQALFDSAVAPRTVTRAENMLCQQLYVVERTDLLYRYRIQSMKTWF